jgi:hypothetical protein
MTSKDTKNIKIGVAILGVGLIGYYLMSGSDSGQGYGDDPTGNNVNPNMPQPTFNAKQAAIKLYDAMRELGTDEDAIMQVFQTVSVSNFPKVYKEFGIRSYNKTMGNQYNFNPFGSLPLENLAVWLENELSSSSFETLRTKYKATNLI